MRVVLAQGRERAKLPAAPVAVFAGLYHPGWSGVRKIKSGLETIDLFGFLTTEPNAVVGAVGETKTSAFSNAAAKSR